MNPDPQNDPLRDLPPPRPGLRRTRRRGAGGGPGFPWGIALVVGLLATALAWWWFGFRADGEPQPTAPAGAPVLDTPGVDDADLTPVAPPEPLDLPPLSASDAFIRRLAAALSAHPRWAAWLATDHLVERFAATVAALSAGASPREQLPAMVPEQPFQVRTSGDRLVIDPASYRRYDAFTAAVSGLDRNGTVRLYQQLHPLFLEAYAQLGFDPATFDADVARAMDNLLAVPVPGTPVYVRQNDNVYEFEDPRLESRSAAEKHILRLGPENALRVQAKLRQLRAALAVAGVLPPAG